MLCADAQRDRRRARVERSAERGCTRHGALHRLRATAATEWESVHSATYDALAEVPCECFGV